MKCPQCLAEGKKSTIYEGGTISTCMAINIFWDENGVKHFHDPNQHTTQFSCSNGHNWGETKINGCSGCDYPSAAKT